MNSLELSYNMKYLSMESRYGANQPPETLSASTQSSSSQDYELDSSMFDVMSASSSFGSQSSLPQHNGNRMVKGWGSALSRSRCVNNLSSLGSASSESSARISQPRPHNANIGSPGWGYYADTVVD